MSENEPLLGRSYTRARRFPLVIGKLPGGGRILGGPYTMTQVGVMVGAIVVLRVAAPIWAHLSYGDALVYIAVPYGLGYLVRRARFEGREPLRAGAGALTAIGAPPAGRLRGRAWREPAPDLLRADAFTIEEGPR
ncbi:hypothetical protein KDK95_20800 [Actinospica sp. MGRD01-02]|uniref:PrgI family protein n=1 Tax=Actinospica acidithermotolerans TaxID=2828514 RepID=A0A941EE36_9ACTN|nr:hypothetical protein [Actinospica acidithermotolerans]MBR7828760.1 hypothetical protein [Actinospica acidithermotolerans]